ncbi:hypothetical protein RRF57_012041 [Xylaria bambusicola]|uniref:Uncharacterized protein n=1 Tax=Xylaria bambusicola TaxID=326684 RepID=A0AAN7V3F8_9PEZI
MGRQWYFSNAAGWPLGKVVKMNDELPVSLPRLWFRGDVGDVPRASKLTPSVADRFQSCSSQAVRLLQWCFSAPLMVVGLVRLDKTLGILGSKLETTFHPDMLSERSVLSRLELY